MNKSNPQSEQLQTEETHLPIKAITSLCQVMARLRSPQGCPWDAQQTADSLRPYILEEAYEVVEAINLKNKDKIREELGDLLLQIVFQAQIFSESGDFTFDDIAAGICDKLIRRHPHVFSAADINDEEDLHRQWEEIKRQERLSRGESDSLLAGLSNALPALMRTQKVVGRLTKSARRQDDPLTLLKQQLDDFESSPSNDVPDRHLQVGALLLNVVKLSNQFNCDAETALNDACRNLEGQVKKAEALPQDAEFTPPEGLEN